jgi:hypothetical protein
MNKHKNMSKIKTIILIVFIVTLGIFLWLSACAIHSACDIHDIHTDNKDAGLPPMPPIELPFEVQKAGAKVETLMRTKEGRIGYNFDLEFKFKKNDPEDRARVNKLTGDASYKKYDGRVTQPGIPIHLRLKIYIIEAAGERPILDKEIHDPQELRLTSGGDDYFCKLIADVNLKPGIYRVSLESLKDVPELIGTPVFLSIIYVMP